MVGLASKIIWIDIFSGWTGCTYAHNLISKPHSVPMYTPYTTELVVAGSNTFINSILWKDILEEFCDRTHSQY